MRPSFHPYEGHRCVNCEYFYDADQAKPEDGICNACGESIWIKKPFPWWLVIAGIVALTIIFGHK
jgi:rubredoxin